MTIKEVSNLNGVSIDSLRYYERIGLSPIATKFPPRTKKEVILIKNKLKVRKEC